MQKSERIPIAGAGDYLKLAKPLSILPHLITATSAMCLAAGGLPAPHILILTLIGGGLAVAASNTLNCYFDRELDGRMVRTRYRPLPAGRITPSQALAFGMVTGTAGLFILAEFVNLPASILAFLALVYYVFAYTLYLKWRTPWNVIIGSGVGGLTPIIGWVAITGHLTATPFLLSAVIILWTLPHFWSLAIYRRLDYEKAGIQALPSKGLRPMIIVSSLFLVGVSLWLAPAAGLGLFYWAIALALGIGFLYLAWQMNEKEHLTRAWKLHSYSIVYIALLFGSIIASRLLG